MEQLKTKLTIYFEEPFWVGLYEREADGRYEVCRVTFGAEPREYQVYEYFLSNWRTLRFSPAIAATVIDDRRKNPKRMQREAHNATQAAGVGTKAQQAIKLQQEQGKTARKVQSKEQREAEAQRQFEIRREKRKEKHRGH